LQPYCPGGGIGRHTSLRGWRRQKRASSSLVLGTFILQFTENQDTLMCLDSLVPMIVPYALDLGIVANDDVNKILPFKLAKLNHQNWDLSKRWEIEFTG
jgi:hypothetical protein